MLDVVAFARSLLLDFGSLTALVDAQPQALFARRGLGGAKVAALLAVRGVLERYHAEVVRDRKVISGSNATRRYLLFCCTPTSRHPNDHIRTRRSSGGL